MMKLDKKKLHFASLWAAVLLCLGVALLLFESDLLWKTQSMNLFLFDGSFFSERMLVPAGMLSYVGTFFTQLMYHPWLGVTALCAWWLLVMWLTRRAFCVSRKWSVLTVVPVALLMVTVVSVGYWVYMLKLHGWLFVAPVGLSVALAALWAFRVLYRRRWQLGLVWAVFTVAVGYPLAGAYALVAAVLMAVWAWRLGGGRWAHIVLTAVVVVAVFAIPLIYYRCVYFQTNIDHLWFAGLPVFFMQVGTPNYYIPYILLAVFCLLMVILSPGWKEDEDKSAYGLIRRYGLQAVVLVAMAVAVWLCWFKDENFHRELRMARCIERTDWEGVLKAGKNQSDEPTRAVVMMHNLAMWRLGLQGDFMYDFPKGSKKPESPIPVYMYNVAGKMIYYQYGLLNECHRMCMEEGVEKGWRAEHLQYLARCAVLGSERQVARKYLNLLRKTMFYGDWADHMEQLLDNPKLLAEARETGPVSHMLHYDNQLGMDQGAVEKYLMTQLANQDSDDPVFQEQTMVASLWLREPSLFWPRFVKYVKMHADKRIPRIYQEAAFLFGSLQQVEFFDKLPVEQPVKDSFIAFMQQMNACQGMPVEQVLDTLYPSFGNTYFYEYFFLKDITYF